MRASFSTVACLAQILVTAQPSLAQSRTRIFDLTLGTPVTALPAAEWVDPACGTDGGPPSLRLESFADFALCPIEARTGLHEVWFIYDDEWEYIARAYRDPFEIGLYSANVFYGQPIIMSLLVDDGGLVQGYRVITDPRAEVIVRREASSLFAIFQSLMNDAPWQCTDLPPEERESAAYGVFLKSDCVMVSEDRFAWAKGRHFRKPGQGNFQVALMPEGYFESSARLDVYALAAVKDAPCCRALLPP